MFDSVITITLNPAIDITINLDDFSFEEPINASSEIMHSGGKAINVSRVLSAMGVKNKAIGVIGQNNSQDFCAMLDSEGVEYDFTIAKGSIRQNLTLVFPDKRVMKINRKGIHFDPDFITNIGEKLDLLLQNTKNTLLVFAGSLPQDFCKDDYIKLINRYNLPNVKISLDTNFFTVDDIKKIRPYIIKPNLVEFSKLIGKDVYSRVELQEGAKMIAPYCEHILVSLGKDGLFYCSGTKMLAAVPEGVEVLSTVGAGDTTLAGFIKSLNDDVNDTKKAVLFAVSAGTASVKLAGTARVSMQQVEDILKTTKLYVIHE
ncbi:MAG: hexose kinase [Oscillospiraceae bacterium]